jgi:hypothetical protein
MDLSNNVLYGNLINGIFNNLFNTIFNNVIQDNSHNSLLNIDISNNQVLDISYCNIYTMHTQMNYNNDVIIQENNNIDNNIDNYKDKYNNIISELNTYKESHPTLFKLWITYLNKKFQEFEVQKLKLFKVFDYATNTISNIKNGSNDLTEENIILLLIYSQYLSNNNI